MAVAATKTAPAAARSAAAPAASSAAPAAAAANEGAAGQGASPSPKPPAQIKRTAMAPAETPPADHAPAEQVKKEKLDFATRMKNAKKTVKEKAAVAKAKGAALPQAASADEADGEEAVSTPEPQQKAASGKSARELLEAGDLDGAFEAAFGKKPQDFKIDSRRWEEWRKAGLRQKKDLADKRAAAEADIGKQRTEINQTIERAKREYGPMIEARKLFKAGDVLGAVKLAFDVEVNDLQKRALAQYHGKNPEVEALRAELAEERRAREKREADARAEAERSQVERARGERLELIRSTLIDGADPQLAKLAVKAGFVKRVFSIQGKHYDAETDSTISIEDAADEARRELLTEFGEAFGVASADRSASAESDRAGSKHASAKNGRAPTSRTLSQRGAAEASEPGRALTQQERLRKYTDLAKAERATE